MSRPFALVLASLLAFVAGCGSASPTPTPSTPQGASVDDTNTSVAGVPRLSTEVQPFHYVLDLSLDPQRDRINGTVDISVQLSQSQAEIYLHVGPDLVIARTSIDRVSVESSRRDGDFLVLTPAEPLKAGEHTLTIRYDAPLKASTRGIYRVNVEGTWYIFSQMEPISARDSLPCFDEPGMKATFDVILRTPPTLVAATNAPLEESTPEGGLITHRFKRSKPMPTYLLAFAVGDFDVIKAPEIAIPNVPFRILTTKGKGEWVTLPLERTPAIMAALAEYFDMSYPYAKLEFVAVPNFSAGAMENPGLVT